MKKLTKQLKATFVRIKADVKTYYIAILLFAVYSVVIRKIFHAFCPFLIMSGFPCAGCGMTRAIYYICTGNFQRGMNLNPAAPLWIIFFIWFFWNRYIIGKNRKYTLLYLSVICVATLLIYIYRMVNYFPGDPPLVYYKDNLMGLLWRLIK